MKAKIILMAMACSSSVNALAQMVVTDPTLEYVTLETKIETASSWVEQLEGLRKTIQLAREQAAKLDSSKRAVEKTYQLQEKVRKDAERNYEAVQKMSKANVYNIARNYLGFSINPADYLPDLPGLEGYSEFKKSAYYDPRSDIDPSTAGIDKFLSSVRMTKMDANNAAIGADNPLEDYYRRLYDINSLAGAYGSLNTGQKKHYFDRMYLKIIPRLQQELSHAEDLLDSTQNPGDIVAITSIIARVSSELEAAINIRDKLITEQVNDAVRSANRQRKAYAKQQDIVALLAAALAGYSHNQGFSLRKLAAARKTEENKARKEVKESLNKKSSRTGAILRQKSTGGAAHASVNPFPQIYSTLKDKFSTLKKMALKKNVAEERVVIVIDCSDLRPNYADDAPSPVPHPLVWDVPRQKLPLPTPPYQSY